MPAAHAKVLVALVGVIAISGCASAPASPSASAVGEPAATATAVRSATVPGTASVVIVGRIVTMDQPPVAEAVFIEDGTVAAVGSRDDVLAVAGDEIPVVDIGEGVAYPGFIDAHAHWIGDRDYYHLDSAAAAMDAAIRRGWTSISEQWVNQERLDELIALAAADALPMRVDAYLALNFGDEFFGDWYESREPGAVDEVLRVRGVKIHVDNGAGSEVNWTPEALAESIRRANYAGWQVSAHAVSTEAVEMLLDAFETAIGPNGPNPLHHRIEHAIQVSDEQLARMVAMDLATVIHLDGVAGDWVSWSKYLGHDSPDTLAGGTDWLGRWRDFVEAGLHVASATDMPWFLEDFTLTDDSGRPVDQVAGGMDGRGRSYPETPEWMLDQLLTAEQGLRAITVDAAWALGDEGRRGHLAPGTVGDVTILSGDITKGTPDEIRTITVVATIVGGRAAWCAEPATCTRLGR
jgi:predicted amidohydrolase YtcJ